MKTVEIGLMRFPHGIDLPAPAYQSAQAAGLDLFAAVPAEVPIVLDPGHWAAIPTGIALTLPPGTEGQVRPRSGLAAVHGITVLNAPGTIDADYRGELKVLLVNLGNRPFAVTRGLRMAQLVIAPVLQVKIAEAARLGETSRGGGGFGSTGGV
jgi:dUTP pyrophosphatase